MLRFIDINNIPDDGYNISKEIQGSELDIDNDCELIKPVVFQTTVKRVKTDVVVEGEIKFSIRQLCSLCLESFCSGRKIPFKIEFKPSSSEPSEEEKELGEEDLDIIYMRGSEIDLFEIIREQIFLSIPIKPVCKPECLGLCQQCGKNLNKEKCNCKNEKIDSRFGALKELKSEL